MMLTCYCTHNDFPDQITLTGAMSKILIQRSVFTQYFTPLVWGVTADITKGKPQIMVFVWANVMSILLSAQVHEETSELFISSGKSSSKVVNHSSNCNITSVDPDDDSFLQVTAAQGRRH